MTAFTTDQVSDDDQATLVLTTISPSGDRREETRIDPIVRADTS